MESIIKSIQTAKMEYPALTKAVKQAHEANMINCIVLGADAKNFKKQCGVNKKKKIL